MNLLVLNEETKMPEPSPEALTIPVFAKIWETKHKIDGDRTGEKKVYNLKVFGYIYFMYHWLSRFRNEPDADEQVKELLQLPPTWYPDDDTLEAIDIFVGSIHIPAQDTVDEMKETLKSTKEWLKVKKGAISNGSMSARDISDVMDLINEMPNTIERLKKAEKMLYEQQMSNAAGRKGRSLGKFERARELPSKRI